MTTIGLGRAGGTVAAFAAAGGQQRAEADRRHQAPSGEH
jgi:hypothetical protein